MTHPHTVRFAPVDINGSISNLKSLLIATLVNESGPVNGAKDVKDKPNPLNRLGDGHAVLTNSLRDFEGGKWWSEQPVAICGSPLALTIAPHFCEPWFTGWYCLA